MLNAPPLPVVAAPEPSDSAPLLPVFADPELNIKRPLEPPVPLFEE